MSHTCSQSWMEFRREGAILIRRGADRRLNFPGGSAAAAATGEAGTWAVRRPWHRQLRLSAAAALSSRGSQHGRSLAHTNQQAGKLPRGPQLRGHGQLQDLL